MCNARRKGRRSSRAKSTRVASARGPSKLAERRPHLEGGVDFERADERHRPCTRPTNSRPNAGCDKFARDTASATNAARGCCLWCSERSARTANCDVRCSTSSKQALRAMRATANAQQATHGLSRPSRAPSTPGVIPSDRRTARVRAPSGAHASQRRALVRVGIRTACKSTRSRAPRESSSLVSPRATRAVATTQRAEQRSRRRDVA